MNPLKRIIYYRNQLDQYAPHSPSHARARLIYEHLCKQVDLPTEYVQAEYLRPLVKSTYKSKRWNILNRLKMLIP